MSIKIKKNMSLIKNIVKDCKCENEIVEKESVDMDAPVCEGVAVRSVSNDDQNDDKNAKYSQWSDMDGKIIPVSNTFPKLESGYYLIGCSRELGIYFKKMEVKLNKLYRLPNEATDIILDDISKFWTLEDTYKRYSRVFRRNYLLYSAPGTGKTSLITLMCQELIEKYNGIVITLTNEGDIENYLSAMTKLRKVEPNRKVITIIEDIDNFIGDGYTKSSLETYILNILDGNLKVDNVVTIATTNFIEKVENRYKNRPSRFDIVMEFPLPNEESRRMFIEKSIMPEDLEKIDIDKWVKKTEGYTIDHINELILLACVFGHSEKEAFERMDKMVTENNRLKNETSVKKKEIGFTTVPMDYAPMDSDCAYEIDN